MALEFPPIYLLDSHIPIETLHDLEEKIPTLTYDIGEARVVLGRVATKQRALFELRKRKLITEEVEPTKQETSSGATREGYSLRPRKRKRLDSSIDGAVNPVGGSAGESRDEDKHEVGAKSAESTQSVDQSSPPTQTSTDLTEMESQSSVVTTKPNPPAIDWGDTIKVLKIEWFTESLRASSLLPLEGYLLYEGRVVRPPLADIPKKAPAPASPPAPASAPAPAPTDILLRAQADAPKTVSVPYSKTKYQAHRSNRPITSVTRPPPLVHQTTSEHDSPSTFPPVPDYLHSTYSCERPTPPTSPNDPFIDLLKKIRTTRILDGDEIGVRAYSTAIATLAAYPYELTSTQELVRLPGCDQKIGVLFQEWKDSGHIATVDELDADERLKVLNIFYEIWGVGAVTAREFYDKGWRDLDDIVEFGWPSLSRVQQIGLKFYDEFQTKIPRDEVEKIGDQILASANKLNPGWNMVIVGGYRRGKLESGDVDVVISHPDEAVTSGFIQYLVEELEKEHVEHTLLMSMANSQRGQTPVSWKGDSGKRGVGFDTLDKALVVWQDPLWPTRDEDQKKNPNAKNPNVHRRVDIIISPWKTVGCAVAGWSSGTTFQRDLRRYARNKRGLKFDSSGIRAREDGSWVDFESIGGTAPDMITAEKRVFEGLQLVWREPRDRCTG